MATAETKSGVQRGVAVVLLFLAGILSLPVVAAFLDGGSTEDLIVPIQLAVMAVVGAITGYLLPGGRRPRLEQRAQCAGRRPHRRRSRPRRHRTLLAAALTVSTGVCWAADGPRTNRGCCPPLPDGPRSRTLNSRTTSGELV